MKRFLLLSLRDGLVVCRTASPQLAEWPGQRVPYVRTLYVVHALFGLERRTRKMRTRRRVELLNGALVQETLIEALDAGRALGVATIAHDHFNTVAKARCCVLGEPPRRPTTGVTRHRHGCHRGVYWFAVARGSDTVWTGGPHLPSVGKCGSADGPPLILCRSYETRDYLDSSHPALKGWAFFCRPLRDFGY